MWHGAEDRREQVYLSAFEAGALQVLRMHAVSLQKVQASPAHQTRSLTGRRGSEQVTNPSPERVSDYEEACKQACPDCAKGQPLNHPWRTHYGGFDTVGCTAPTLEAWAEAQQRMCNRVHVKYGPCMLEYGHVGEHQWKNPPTKCQHDRLDEDGICRSCGADKRASGAEGAR